jgi:polysaccharide biosynthesis protein PslH
MRLLVVSTWLPYPPDNGSRVRAYNLLRELSRRHRLTLLSFGVPSVPEGLSPLRATCERVEVVPPTTSPGGRPGAHGLLSPTPRHYVQTDSPRMRALVGARVRENDAAIALQATAARYLADCPQVPRVFEEAEVAVFRERCQEADSVLRRFRHRLTWWKHRRFIRRLVNRFEQTTVVSIPEREQLRAAGCDVSRVSVVPNGVEVPVLPSSGIRAARVIYPGAVTYSANLDAVRYFVNDIWPLIQRSRADLEFLVTGSTDGVHVENLAANPGVTFTGRLREVDTWIAGSAVCVVPLRIGGGTRLKILQAMAVGTPVVSTTKGIEGLDVIPDHHVLIGDSPEAFAREVLKLLHDQALGLRIAEAARRLVDERYTWRSIGEGLERVLERALEHRGSRAPDAGTASCNR